MLSEKVVFPDYIKRRNSHEPVTNISDSSVSPMQQVKVCFVKMEDGYDKAFLEKIPSRLETIKLEKSVSTLDEMFGFRIYFRKKFL